MRYKSSKCWFTALVMALAILLTAGAAFSQTSAFTYQGRLTDAGAAANGPYDLQFALFDSATGGTQIGTRQGLNAVSVNNGIFTVTLDFGANAFAGANRFLEISVQRAGGGFSTLSPRQQISSTPYAIRTLSAASADTAANATQLGGVAASQYVQTNDSRLSDSRSPTAGSSNYIQNATMPQSSASFNISGNGTVGTNLTARSLTVVDNGSVFGSLGVGTTSPAQALEVNGITSLGPPGSVYGYLVPGSSPGPYPTAGFNTYGPSYQAGSAGYGGIFQFQNGDGKLIYYTGSNVAAGDPHVNSAMVTISNEGRVGIGTTNPLANLHVSSVLPELRLEATSTASLAQTSYKTPGRTWTTGVDTTFFLNPIYFIYDVTAGVNRMVINTSGNVGIGTENPADKLTVKASTVSGFNIFGVRDSTNTLSFGVTDDGLTFVLGKFSVNGRARISSIPLGASSASVCFNAAGDLLQCGASSLRWKTNVRPFLNGLDIVRRLRPISFNWKEGGLPDIGLGAEDVAKVAPSLTFADSKGEVTGVKYERLNILLLNAIKEQQNQIEKQENQIASLRTANANLNARLQAVEKHLRKRVTFRRRRV